MSKYLKIKKKLTFYFPHKLTTLTTSIESSEVVPI